MFTHHPLGLPLVLALGMLAVSTTSCSEATTFAADGQAERSRPSDVAPSNAASTPFADLEPTIEDLPPAPRPKPLPERAQAAFDAADRLGNEGHYTEAAIELEKALREAPDDPRILRRLALVHWLDGDAARAREYAEAAVHVAPNDLVSHYLLGRLAARRFENDAAIREFRIALHCTVEPTCQAYLPLTQYHLAETLAAEGYFTAALEIYDRFTASLAALPPEALQVDELRSLAAAPETIAQRAAGVAAQLGRYDAAADRLLNAYPEADMPASVRRTAAEYLVRAGRLDDALQQARQAAQSDPSAIALLKEIHAQRGTPEALVTDLRELLKARPDDVDLVLNLALALVELDRTDEAESLLRQRLGDHPQEARVSWALFRLLGERGAWSAALDVAADAIRSRDAYAEEAAARIADLPAEARAALIAASQARADTDHAGAFLRGVLADAAGRTDDAVAACNAALSARPGFLPARIHLAQLHLGQYAWSKVIATATPADVELPADTRLAKILGDARVGLDQLEQAITHYQDAIRLNRANTAAMLALAELYADTGQSNAAIRQLETLVEADPLNERGRELLFRAYLADRDRRAAAEQLAQLRRIAASPTTIARCVAWLEFEPAAPDTAQFRKTLREAMEAYRPDAETLHLVALSLLQERRADDAIPVLQQALELDPGHRASAELLATAYRANLDFGAAADARRTLLDRYPNNIAWRDDLLEMVLAIQDFAEAERLLNAWLADDQLAEEQRTALRDMLLNTHLLQEDYDAALELLDQMRAASPGDPFELRRTIAICQRAGQHERALALLRQWPDAIPRSFAAIDMAPVWENLIPEQHDDVLHLLLAELAENPDDDHMQVALIELLRAAGRFDEALELANGNRAASRNPALYEEQILSIYSAAGRMDDAVNLTAELLLESGRENLARPYVPIRLRDLLVRLMLRAGRSPAAVRDLNRWIEEAQTVDERVYYLNLLAVCHQENNDDAEAIQTLELVLELSPDSIGASNDLGYTLADTGRDLDRAETLIRFAVANEPRNSAYLDSYGWLLYKRGDFAGARRWLTRARYAGEGEDPVVCQHLGDACWRLGEQQAAIDWWRQSTRFSAQRLQQPWASQQENRTLAEVEARLQAAQAGEPPPLAPLADPHDTSATDEKGPAAPHP